jgi:hypothetical protein
MSKESGLVLDAVRYGVPLVISDNDAALTQKLRDARWAALFATGDPASLAAVLDRVGAEPLPRPDADAARSFGLRTGAEMLELFVELGAEAAERCRGR